MDEERLPFTFLKEQVGSYFTLESAVNHRYFIYTSDTPRQPVGVTKDLGKEKKQLNFKRLMWNSIHYSKRLNIQTEGGQTPLTVECNPQLL